MNDDVTAEHRVQIAVVIPALNEEQSIGDVVREIPRGLADDIIVVDNGSSDRTARVARLAGARVIREERKGYGSACLAGVRAAGPVDVIVFLDGDRSDDPSEMRRLLAPLFTGDAGLTIGSRLGKLEAGAIPPHQRFGNEVALLLLRLLYGLQLTDLGSFRAIPRSVLDDLQMNHPTYGWPVEMIVKAAKKGIRIREVPVTYRRRTGRSKVGGTMKGSLSAGYHMIDVILRSRFG